MQILLSIEVFTSFLLIFTLLFLVVRRKEQLFSKAAFGRLQEAKKAKRALVLLFFLALGSFILHELIEILPDSSSRSLYMKQFNTARHFFIYLFLIAFQGIGVYMTLRLTRSQDDIR